MPALGYDQCPADMRMLGWYIGLHGHEPDQPLRQHGRECPLTSRHRDGFWRWFWATIRCYCPCHQQAAS